MKPHPGLGDMLLGLSATIQRRHAQICAEHDLTPAQSQLLCTIKDQPRRMVDLAAQLGMAKPALSQLIDRIEARGLVRRTTSEQDRRVVMLHATPEGQKIGRALYEDVDARLPDLLGALTPDDQEQFAGLLAKVHVGRCPHRTT
ncbi:MarR family winged helix-turn-helix transcriptional regulator [Actinoplanes sp. L3-i22]|uniref:MarR family winged helix-turn-helix transcriptional regulator n=1 Tax=Actinoplanes sp. L3-i22 TaxID=2836373 RepID=UPI001C753FD1|nr:MarR family transcriptional regulator [Actinoplanes sp. L3-i22]BCY08265.1 transcriptional regulator [Actinoplanes sp. L3-i22]